MKAIGTRNKPNNIPAQGRSGIARGDRVGEKGSGRGTTTRWEERGTGWDGTRRRMRYRMRGMRHPGAQIPDSAHEADVGAR